MQEPRQNAGALLHLVCRKVADDLRGRRVETDDVHHILASLGSAMEKPLLTIPTVTSFACGLNLRRYWASACAG